MSNLRQQVHDSVIGWLARIVVLSGLVFIYAMVAAMRGTMGNLDTTILIVGSVLAPLGASLYIIVILDSFEGRETKPHWGRSLSPFFNLAGFAPYLFGVYIVVFKGLWGLGTLLNDFSIGRLVVALLAIIVGYYIVQKTWLITKAGKIVDERFAARR